MDRKERQRQKRLEKKLQKEKLLLRFSTSPEILERFGPIIITDIGISEAHRHLLEEAGFTVPQKKSPLSIPYRYRFGWMPRQT